MKNLIADFDTIPSELFFLKKYLKGNFSKQHDIYILDIHPEMGKGQIRYVDLQSGLQVFDFDITLTKDIEIPMDCITTETLQFLYCLEGNCYHQFEDSDEIKPIEEFQTAVAHSDLGLQSRLLFKKEYRVVLNTIYVNKKEYFDKFSQDSNPFSIKLQTLLYHISSKSKHFHSGRYSLKIAEQLKLLLSIEHTNEISQFLSQKGRYYLILAKQIEQFYLEIDNETNTSGLLKKELKMISVMSDFIKEHPEIQHSIKSLCLESGVSPAKLQEGFKFMFERTVSDFVRNIRLEKAERLIKSTDLTISEIVYSVGLTSRSYFCKIFKKKYNCSPKEYKSKYA